MNKNINGFVNANEEDKATVVVRRSDFKPNAVEGKEYFEVSRKLYDEYYAPKLLANKRATVRIKVSDLLRCIAVDTKQDKYIEVVMSVYDEIKEYDVDCEGVILRVRDYYPDDKTGEKYMFVGMNVYEGFENERKLKKKQDYFDTTWTTAFPFDEIKAGEMMDIYSPSVEEEFFREIKNIIVTDQLLIQREIYLM